MKLELRMEYLETIYRRYRQSPKESKGKILDELRPGGEAWLIFTALGTPNDIEETSSGS